MQTAAQSPARSNTPVVTVPGAQGSQTITIPTPRTARDIDALKARREELSNQLQSVDSRRSKLISQLKQTGDLTAIKGLEGRLGCSTRDSYSWRRIFSRLDNSLRARPPA